MAPVMEGQYGALVQRRVESSRAGSLEERNGMQRRQHRNEFRGASSEPGIRYRSDRQTHPVGLGERNPGNNNNDGDSNDGKKSSARENSHGKANRGNDDDDDNDDGDSIDASFSCDDNCGKNSNGKGCGHCSENSSAAGIPAASTSTSTSGQSSATTSTGSSTVSTSASSSSGSSSSASTSRSIGAGSDRNGAQQLTFEPASTSALVLTSPEALAPIATTAILATVVTGPDSVVTSFIPLLTTTPLTSLVTSTSVSKSGITSTSTSSAESSISTSSNKKHKTASTEAENDSDGDKGNGTNNNKGSSHKSSGKPLDPTAERALISAGSIGAFIIVCFIVWLVWRTIKKQRRRKHSRALAAAAVVAGSPASPSAAAAIQQGSTGIASLPRRLFERIAARIPFPSRWRGTWQTLGDKAISDSVAAAGNNNLGRQPADPYGNEKSLGMSNSGQPAMSSLSYQGGDLSYQMEQQQQQHAAAVAAQNKSLTAGTSRSSSSIYSQQMAAPLASETVLTAPGETPYGAAEVPVVGPTADSFYTGAGSMNDTLRSRMPDPFYNQSQLARQPSDAYDPMRRQVNRVSELSSLSSGFGDGEILIDMELPPKQQQSLNIPPLPSTPPAAAHAGAGHFSWMRTSKFVPSSRRETVYTEASDDQPPRFRTVTSWVHQQTGRVRRAQQRSNETNDLAAVETADGTAGVTGVYGSVQGGQANMSADAGLELAPGIAHPMPEEQRLTMMADDGEIPRRPETVPGIQTNLR